LSRLFCETFADPGTDGTFPIYAGKRKPFLDSPTAFVGRPALRGLSRRKVARSRSATNSADPSGRPVCVDWSSVLASADDFPSARYSRHSAIVQRFRHRSTSNRISLPPAPQWAAGHSTIATAQPQSPSRFAPDSVPHSVGLSTGEFRRAGKSRFSPATCRRSSRSARSDRGWGQPRRRSCGSGQLLKRNIVECRHNRRYTAAAKLSDGFKRSKLCLSNRAIWVSCSTPHRGSFFNQRFRPA
jgi:hypothetical protein